MRSTIFSILILPALALLCGCQECEECERIASAPSTSLVFINSSALATVELAQTRIQDEVDTLNSQLTVVNNEIIALETGIDTLEQLVAEGRTDLVTELAEANELLTVKEAEQIGLQALLEPREESLDSLESLQSTIESGAVVVSRILNLKNGLQILNSDTLTTYFIPLEVTLDETAYELEIAGSNYDLTINYEREQTLDIERVVRITASSLTVSSSSFDPILVECPETNPNCRSGETVITCYF